MSDPAAGPRDSRPSGPLRVLRASLTLLWRAAPRAVAVSLLLLLVVGVGVALRVLLAAALVDRLVAESASVASLGPYLVALGVLIVATEFAIGLRPHVLRLLEGAVMRHTEQRILEASSRAPYAAFDQPTYYQLFARAQTGTQTRTAAMVQGTEGVLDGVVGLASLLVVLVLIDPLLAGVVLLAYVPALLTSLRSGKGYYDLAAGLTARDRRRRYVVDLLGDREGAKEIRANGSEPWLSDRLGRMWDERSAELSATVRARIGASALAALGTGTITVAAAVVIFYGVTSGRLSVAAAAAAVLVLWEATSNVQVLSWSVGQMRETGLFVGDYNEFLGSRWSGGEDPSRGQGAPSGRAATPTSLLAASPQTVDVRGVRLRYAGREDETLRGVDLTLERGRLTALVGLSGAGKTTLVKVLCGLYRPDAGRLLWDGTDVTGEQELLRQRTSVIFQDYVRYAFTAELNVGLGNASRLPDHPGVRAAAAAAGADDVLSGLPQGYATELSTAFGGVDLSGGQWQRVALARALFRDAALLVLDEPTSALDPRTERQVIETIRARCRDRAVLVVSHRLTVVEQCDAAAVMEDGRIVETGTHDELLARGGIYHELYRARAQSSGQSSGLPTDSATGSSTASV